jgi:hypothetical protein
VAERAPAPFASASAVGEIIGLSVNPLGMV